MWLVVRHSSPATVISHQSPATDELTGAGFSGVTFPSPLELTIYTITSSQPTYKLGMPDAHACADYLWDTIQSNPMHEKARLSQQ